MVVINPTMWSVGFQNWFTGETWTSLKIPRLAEQNLLGLLMGVWKTRTPIQIVDSKGWAHERGKKIPSGQEVCLCCILARNLALFCPCSENSRVVE